MERKDSRTIKISRDEIQGNRVRASQDTLSGGDRLSRGDEILAQDEDGRLYEAMVLDVTGQGVALAVDLNSQVGGEDEDL